MLTLMRPKMTTSRKSGTRVSLLKILVSMKVSRTMPMTVAAMMIRSRRLRFISAVRSACCFSTFWSMAAGRGPASRAPSGKYMVSENL